MVRSRLRLMTSLVFSLTVVTGLTGLGMHWYQECSGGEVPSQPTQPPPPTPAAQPAQPPIGMVRVLSLEQTVEGMPDQPADRPIHQRLRIDEVRRRLILVLYGPDPSASTPGGAEGKVPTEPRTREVDRRIILNMSATTPEILEVWDAEKVYRRTTRDLTNLQEERDRQEANMLRHLSEVPEADRKALIEENFLRTDGKRIVDIVRGGTRRILDRECQEVKVVENGRTVIHAWVTKDAAGSKGFFHLYQRLGVFSRQVLDRVVEMEGLPLEAEITVVTAAPTYQLRATCTAITTEDIPVTDFDLPPSYQERKVELPAVLPCPWDKKPVEPAEARWKTMLKTREILYFCSKDCMEKWNEEDLRKAKEAGRKAPDPAPAAPAGSKSP